MTKDGKPYGPFRYKEIVQERYFITKNTHITYNETGEMTPIERDYIVQFIIDDDRKNKEKLEKDLQNLRGK